MILRQFGHGDDGVGMELLESLDAHKKLDFESLRDEVLR